MCSGATSADPNAATASGHGQTSGRNPAPAAVPHQRCANRGRGSYPAPKPAAATQPRSGGTLRAAITADLPNLDPHINTTTAHENLFLAFDRIIQYDEQLHPRPMLAESWDLSADLRQIQFNLRKGVQWHTGREFTQRRREVERAAGARSQEPIGRVPQPEQLVYRDGQLRIRTPSF